MGIWKVFIRTKPFASKQVAIASVICFMDWKVKVKLYYSSRKTF